MSSTHEIAVVGESAEQKGGPIPEIKAVEFPDGEIVPSSVTALGGIDQILHGYMITARALGSEVAADLYKKFKPESELDAAWFQRNKNII